MKLLPYFYEAVHVPGKANVTLDAFSWKDDSPVPPIVMMNPVDLASASLGIGLGYSTMLGPPSWVSRATQDLLGSLRKPQGCAPQWPP